ncbi:MAG: SUF system NifU family Fe-S cluster assembly protein [Candidatus Micrarchaeota archaeon]|nr:SUF system NifU family Fe-S cluster assembly protein [Candidatus Micrarchaeota archaeon]
MTQTSSSTQMYSEIILDYYRHPRNFGTISKPDASSHEVNPLCGDEVTVQLKIKGGKVEKIKFNGKGCAISQASTSMLCEHIEGKKLEEVVKMSKEEALELLGINLSPMRLKCALLGFKAAKLAAFKYLGVNEK